MQPTAATPNPNQNAVILTSRLKVLHIISGDLWAGAEVQAFTLITTLANQCDIHVALMNHGELEERLKYAGINTSVINEQHLSSLTITRQLSTLIRSFQPNIIHTHRQKENILGSLANVIANKSFFNRTPSLRTTHGAQEHKIAGLKNLIPWLDNFCGRHLQDAVISVSNNLKEQLKHVFPEEKIHVIQNGVNTEELSKTRPAEDIQTPEDNRFHIGIIGRLEPVKRVDLFIHTAQEVILQEPNLKVRFHIIGDGNLKNDLGLLAQQLNIEDQIIFHGHRSDSTKAIAAMHLVIMCSDHEGTPMTALEALALGKPLIAHNVGGLSEILSEYPELLVDQHTPHAYSSKILHFLLNPIIPRLKSNYSNQQNAMNTLALYRSLSQKMSDKFTSQNLKKL